MNDLNAYLRAPHGILVTVEGGIGRAEEMVERTTVHLKGCPCDICESITVLRTDEVQERLAEREGE